MGVSASFEIAGLPPVLETIGALERRLRNVGPAWTVVANLLEGHVAKTFATAGAHVGKPWQALASSTVRMREKGWGYYGRQAATAGVGPTGPILVWQGRLRSSFRRGSSEHIRQIDESTLHWGSRVPYGIYHHSLAPRRRLPRRRLLDFRDPFQRRQVLVEPLRLWLQGVPPGAIEATMSARLGFGPLGVRGA